MIRDNPNAPSRHSSTPPTVTQRHRMAQTKRRAIDSREKGHHLWKLCHSRCPFAEQKAGEYRRKNDGEDERAKQRKTRRSRPWA